MKGEKQKLDLPRDVFGVWKSNDDSTYAITEDVSCLHLPSRQDEIAIVNGDCSINDIVWMNSARTGRQRESF